MEKPYYQCPRFDSCSINKCPLDPDVKDHPNLPGEDKCGCYKSIRMKLGANLPNLGLTPGELKAKKRWENLSPEEKEAMRARGKALAAKRKAQRAKGGKNT